MRRNWGPVYTLPVTFWIASFFVAPLCIIVLYSFLRKGLYGGVSPHFSLQAYSALINPTFLYVGITTLLIAIASAFLMMALALPASYYIARSPRKQLLLLLIIIPFWTNFLIRIYAWIAILGNNGFINSFLMSTGLTDAHLHLLYNKYAVVLVTVYTYLPYAILPLYSTMEKFDFSLLEAAQDLGASRSQAFFRILLPNVKSGISTAILFTFIPAFGSYAIPQILGGPDSLMLGTIIARELTITRNWPLAASISVVLTAVTTLGVILFMRMNASAQQTVREKGNAEKPEMTIA